MPYLCQLKSGQQVSLDNQGTKTIVIISSSLPGQQQQTSSSLATGVWTAAPEAYQTITGTIIKLSTAQGPNFIQIQDGCVSVIGKAPALDQTQPLQLQQTTTLVSPSMQPMQPMQPMKMDDMQMSMNPMAMQMGNMAMAMGATTTPSASTRRFCSQCGAKVNPADRFCSSCGQVLQ